MDRDDLDAVFPDELVDVLEEWDADSALPYIAPDGWARIRELQAKGEPVTRRMLEWAHWITENRRKRAMWVRLQRRLGPRRVEIIAGAMERISRAPTRRRSPVLRGRRTSQTRRLARATSRGSPARPGEDDEIDHALAAAVAA